MNTECVVQVHDDGSIGRHNKHNHHRKMAPHYELILQSHSLFVIAMAIVIVIAIAIVLVIAIDCAAKFDFKFNAPFALDASDNQTISMARLLH